jgi:alpha-1,3-mannosyltransferase
MLILQLKLKDIGVLHCFNDALLSLVLIASIYFLIQKSSSIDNTLISVVLLSLAINIKMSALLVVPGYMICLFYHEGIWIALLAIVSIVLVQVALGLPFLISNYKSYLDNAYNFDRKFSYGEQLFF